MEGKIRNWGSLPVEILHKIFQLAVENKSTLDSRHFSLVCKSWLIPAQEVLYKAVKLSELPRLKQFHNSVKQAAHIGEKVKAFHLQVPDLNEEDRIVTSTFLSELLQSHLPNLEELEENTLKSYVPVLNALQESQSKRLKRINTPDVKVEDRGELANYATCVLLMKDRIDKVKVFEESLVLGKTMYRNPYFNRLYDRLHLLEKLEDLDFIIQTDNEIEALEYVLSKCKSLKCLSSEFVSLDISTSISNNNISIEEILKLEPVSHINKLQYIYAFHTTDWKIIFYIAHKFPLLQHLELSFRHEGTVVMNHDTLLHLLKYTTSMKVLLVDFLRIDVKTITETFAEYWRSISAPVGSKSVQILYTDDLSDGAPAEISLSRTANEDINSFLYPSTCRESHYINFFKENGVYLKKVTFRFFKEDNDLKKYVLPSNFMDLIFTSCPNIRILNIDSCIIHRFNHSKINFTKNIILDEFYLNKCILYKLALEQISMLVTEIKLMRIGGFANLSAVEKPVEVDDLPDDPLLEIIMTHTKIDRISFEDVPSDKILLVKMFVASERIFYYRRYSDNTVHTSSEEEYTANGSNKMHVYICCKTNPEITFNQ